MIIDQPVMASIEDEIDLWEGLAALQRRWRWVVGGGLLGLTLAVGSYSYKTFFAVKVEANLIVDVAQGPCYSRVRRQKTYIEPHVVARSWSGSRTLIGACSGELGTMYVRLDRLAKQLESEPLGIFDYSINRHALDGKGRQKSDTQIVLNLTAPASLAPEISPVLEQIQKDMTLQTANSAKTNGIEPYFGIDWIRIEKPTKIATNLFSQLIRTLVLGSLGGLVVGASSALIADRRSDRVYSREELLRRLNHPLRLGLPAGQWSNPAVPVLVGQLASQLDQSLSWRVLSIARQHQAVAPLTQLLQQQGGPALECRSADPLLAAVLRMDSINRPTGLLLVVEPGFNSARALEEACLLISQMSNVQAVGIVLIGAPLPEELSSLAAW